MLSAVLILVRYLRMGTQASRLSESLFQSVSEGECILNASYRGDRLSVRPRSRFGLALTLLRRFMCNFKV